MQDKVKVGVIGLGMMGNTHLDVYAKRDDVQVTAIADLIEEKRIGRKKAAGNIEGQAKGGFDFTRADLKRYEQGAQLIAEADVDMVDICVETHNHAALCLEALGAGKHVLIEKPLARTFALSRQLAEAAAQSKGLSMCAMCMRFWPGWTWLKDAVEKQTYGKVLAATFRRVAAHPGGFYSDGEKAGGAILDLHIHDADFIRHVFGMPLRVSTHGYRHVTSEPDHVVTRYDFGSGGPLIVAEGCWAMARGFGFSMHYAVNFEHATAEFTLGRPKPLMLYQEGQKTEVDLPAGMGYAHEIDYFLQCVKTGQPATRVTLADAAQTVRLIEAEHASLDTGSVVEL